MKANLSGNFSSCTNFITKCSSVSTNVKNSQLRQCVHDLCQLKADKVPTWRTENRESEHQVPTPAKALLAIGKASEGKKVIFCLRVWPTVR